MLHEMRCRWTEVVLTVLVTLGIAACQPMTGAPVSNVTQEIRAFPCDVASNTQRGREAAFLLAGEVQPNEVHDCQKLVVDGRFGALVAIYPLPAVAQVDSTSLARAHPTATVFNWGPESYAPLGIEPDWNCLWLWGSGSNWSAVMTRPQQDGCQATDPEGPPAGTRLEVHRLAQNGLRYPSTARWGWDGANDVHYIGIRCGNGWCRVGQPGFQPRETTLGTGGVDEVPGWYDDQNLAVPDGQGGLIPGPWATIYPAPGLDTLKVSHYSESQIVGTVVIPRDGSNISHYQERWNFQRGVNTLLLHHSDGQWFMTVRPEVGDSAVFSVDRQDQMHAVKGAVRWRWDSEDESTWIGCDDACCTPVR